VPVFESQNRLHDVHTLCAGLVINADAQDRTNPLANTCRPPLSTEDSAAMNQRTCPTNNPEPSLRYSCSSGCGTIPDSYFFKLPLLNYAGLYPHCYIVQASTSFY